MEAYQSSQNVRNSRLTRLLFSLRKCSMTSMLMAVFDLVMLWLCSDALKSPISFPVVCRQVNDMDIKLFTCPVLVPDKDYP